MSMHSEGTHSPAMSTPQIGQQVTVIDGGWSGNVERINTELQAAYVRFPDCPELRPYAFEALSTTEDQVSTYSADDDSPYAYGTGVRRPHTCWQDWNGHCDGCQDYLAGLL